MTRFCVQAYRAGNVAGSSAGGARSCSCSMIVVFVDDVRVIDVASFLERTAAEDLQSIEFLGTAAATSRYPATAGYGEILVIWSFGRGPYRNVRR